MLRARLAGSADRRVECRVTQVENIPAQSPAQAQSEAADWVRSNWLVLSALALIALQLLLKGAELEHAYFRQDDFAFLDQALDNRHLTASFLFGVYGGHLKPGAMLYIWLLARLSLYDWTLASTVSLALLAASSLALLRLLRTLFGDRPAILIPLLVYLFTPIMLPGLVFWTATLQWLPLQLALFMALNAHVVYTRTGRYRHVLVAAVWIGFGMAFDDAAVLIPLLFVALTSAFADTMHWSSALTATLRRQWRAWLLYAVLMAGYVALFWARLAASAQLPTKPGPFDNVLSFASTLLRVSLVPGALGGPWRWFSIGDYAFATEVPGLTQVSWAVAAAIILVSLWYRRRAWRAWVILAGWVFVSAIAPLVVGRIGIGSATVLGGDLHYLDEALPVLAVCVGLAFLPLVGEENAYRGRPPLQLRLYGVGAVVILFMVGSLWTYQSYAADTSSAPQRSYLATAREALAAVPKGSVIVSSPTPTDIEINALFGRFAYTSQLIGPLAQALPNQHLRFTDSPNGAIPNLLMFDSQGRLWRAFMLGRQGAPPKSDHGCWTVGYSPVRIKIPGPGPVYNWPWTLDLTYLAPTSTIAVEFDGRSHSETLPAGLHDVYVPARGSGRAIMIEVTSGGPDVCIAHLAIGNPEPSLLSKPIPAVPVTG
jgi:hypothetical protein